tara:strand:+ start:801 stop:992 length:192 start_codon:yes stop_codon:yes gene_type:complete
MQDISEKIMARHGLTPMGFLRWQANHDSDVMMYLIESFLELADSREVTDLLTELYLELGEGLD